QKGVLHLAYNRLKLAPNAIMKYYTVAECRKHIAQLCEAFELCPKYCHLQTNVSSCFHYQLKECRGICCDKETVANYNKRVNEAIKSVGIGAENLVITENGVAENEIGFALILNGIYQGFGYLDKEQAAQLTQPEDYQFFVQPKKDNRDVQRIVASYLKKKAKLTQE
ncbi:MAG: DNA polymerase III subunit epsilon, partial [Polaribacter sp.]